MLEQLRLRLARAEALPLLALLGVICGLLAGAVIIAFRLSVEWLQWQLLPDGNLENYEGLSSLQRFMWPLLGGFLLGIFFQFISRDSTRVGVAHVMERLAYHQGRLPWRNAVVQFVGAAISIVSGHSVGREGPSVHLGAVNGSLLGCWLQLPNNSNRVLVACGSAAAIGAAFNTPLAGVIFAMEVVMMEYTILSFTPVILAAVSATALTHLVFGSEPAFSIPSLGISSLSELPLVLLTGLVVGCLSALFIYSLRFFVQLQPNWPVWFRLTLAGLITGICAQFVPEVMSIGYDTVNQAFLGELALTSLLMIVAFKMLATTAGLGLGLPGGLISPILFIGATAGGVIGVLGHMLFPDQLASPGFYAMLGMGAMMAGALQAPLAALMALLELTANPNILLPGMLAVIAATMTSSELFGRGPLFVELLKAQGLDYRNDPVALSLRRVSVGGVMNRNFRQEPRVLSILNAKRILNLQPQWILIKDAGEPPLSLLPAADLARFIEELDLAPEEGQKSVEHVDLGAIPAQRLQVSAVEVQATLQEAREIMNREQAEALYVIRDRLTRNPAIFGILTRQEIEANYLYSHPSKL